jgi:hemolysin-activating ACP:hemolysin acyltransferase
MRHIGTLWLAFGLLAGCTPLPRSATPAEFAAYESKESLQAVSAERVVYQLKRLENKPFAELAFWQVALKERLLKAGYVLSTEGAIEASGHKGYFIETTAPRGTADYMYLVALFVQDKNLIVIESAGEIKAYKAQREKIFAAIRASDLAGAAAR